ncbi:MAG TPA: amidase family protein [Acidimicrobiia bacterium]|nr:amidase family protein [Acidimicrobiia bacterium]
MPRCSALRRGAALVAAIALAGCSTPSVAPTSITDAPTTVAATTTAPVTTTTTTVAPTTTTLPARPIDPAGLTIPEMQEAMTAGSLTSVGLTRWYLWRIARFDDAINSVIAIHPGAMLAAIESDRLRRAGVVLGPLHGIPVLLKDNIGTGDMPTTAGSVALEGFIPIADATQVARLREAGAIILAKTNLYEFARDIRTVSSLGGTTRNPYDLARNPGGSSGGTGAAVAAEFGAAGLGTDTCGSIRIPAAFNHLYGLRPTVGLTPTDGVIPLSFTEDTAGPLARSVIDLAIVLDVTAASGDRYTSAAQTGSLEGVRIGVVDLLFSGADPAVAAAGRAALDLMAAHGAEIVPAPIPGFNSLRGSAASVFLREWRPALDEYLAAQPEAPYRSMAEIAASGDYLPALSGPISRALGSTLESSEYRNALDRRTVVQETIEGWMDDNDLDALAYPPISQPPAPIGSGQEGNNCGTASVGGLPAIVIPAGFTSQGWPVGLELLGRRQSEEILIGIAAGYEKIAPEWQGPDLGD